MPLRRAVLLLALPVSLLPLLSPTPAAAASPNLVISSVYGGGGNSGATYTHDYVELFNRGASEASTAGLSLQYASATGTGAFGGTASQLVALPDRVVPAGGYLLVQLAGGSTGSPLPAPDATGTINAGAGSGKFALAEGTTSLGCNGGSTPCTTEQRDRIVDLVGYGSANFYEGTAAAPTLSNSTAALRKAGGCTDTDDNAADFTAGTPAPRNAATAAQPCGTTAPEPQPEPTAVQPISSVQGTGAESPLSGQTVTVEAVLTALTTSNDARSGFYLQEQDADADGDAASSEGLQVYCGSACPADLAAGDLVRVTGAVGERYGTTQIDAAAGETAVVARGLPRPTPAVVELPASASLKDGATFEPLEGMLATVATTLAVSEFYNLARYGELVLTAGSRPYQFTHTSAPSTEGFAAHKDDLERRRLVLDDDNDDQNDAVSGPASNEPYPYPTGGLALDNRFRGGDTIEQLTGVLQYAFNTWRMRPAADQTYTFTSANPRPAQPADVGGRLRVATSNVLNYFTTIDSTSANDSGSCGPSGTMDCRGADSPAELERQRAKTVAALVALDADVLGIVEVQNDDDVALADLVAALNDATAPGTYDYVRTGPLGTDAIKVGFVYQPASVELAGPHAVLTSAVDPRFDDTRNRPALVQTFRERATGEVFTAAVNHLKSKGSACDGDPDKNDGAGNCDGTRTSAAQALADFLATDPTGSGDPDRLVIGDLNAYKREAPITALKDAGYTDLVERFGGEGAYSYLFDGQLGYLDHALGTDSLTRQVTGATEWHVNADEPVLFDYNDDVRDTGEAWYDRESDARALYAADPYRSSDHDPVVLGLALGNPTAEAGGPYRTQVGRTVTLDASASTDPDADPLGFAWDLDGDGQYDDATGPTVELRASRPPGSYPVSVLVSDGRLASADTATLEVVAPGREQSAAG